MHSKVGNTAAAATRRWTALALCALLLGGCWAGGGARAADVPGADKLIRLADGRRINLRCAGRGSPTVIFESGWGASADAWSAVMPAVAARARACAYDRAGYGLSDPAPAPRDGAAIARDLDEAIQRAGLRGPFVLVGHSAGGLYARLFAGRRLGEVVGLVMVDPSVEYQDRAGGSPTGQRFDGLGSLRAFASRCIQAAASGKAPDAELEAAGCVSRDADARTRAAARDPRAWRDRLSELEELFDRTSQQAARTRGVLKDIPMIVLTADGTAGAGGGDPQNSLWTAMHRRLAATSLAGQQRLVHSSHLMMFDRPEAVSGAIRELVDAADPKSPRKTR